MLELNPGRLASASASQPTAASERVASTPPAAAHYGDTTHGTVTRSPPTLHHPAAQFYRLSLRRYGSQTVTATLSLASAVLSMLLTALLAPLFLEHTEPGMMSLSFVIGGVIAFFFFYNLSPLIEALDAAERHMADLTVLDDLTGAHNRRFLGQVAPDIFARARALDQPLSVVVMDLDYFKTINDTLGHAAGDQVLVMIKQLCDRHLRATDVLVRAGGEEFLFLLPFTDIDGAGAFAERLRSAIWAHPFDIGANRLQVTASFGVAALTSAYQTLEQLTQAADEAVYGAKRAGRNQVKVAFDGVLQPELPW